MNNRRNFLKKTALGSFGFLATPSVMSLNNLKYLEEFDFPSTFKTYEERFQDIYKDQKAIDKTTQQLSGKQTFRKGENRRGDIVSNSYGLSNQLSDKKKYAQYVHVTFELDTYHIRRFYRYFDSIPFIMSSPFCNLHLHNNGLNTLKNTQCFRSDRYNRNLQSYEEIIFTQNGYKFDQFNNISSQLVSKDDYLVIAPCFNKTLADKRYSCYSAPLTNPITGYCYKCDSYYIMQFFCYNTNDPYDGVQSEPIMLIAGHECKNLHTGVRNHSHYNIPKAKDLIECRCNKDIKVQYVPLV